MKIFITNLTQYNQGRIIGQWAELPCTEEQLQDTLSRVLCLDEECFITDSEGFPFDVHEYDNPYDLNRKMEQYEALEGHERLCVAFLMSEGYDWEYALEHHEDVILYAEEDLEDVAYTLVEIGCFGKIPESLSNYIDYEAIARDLGHDGFVQKEEGVYYYAE
ncbi:MAG: antirestriction protein ArdA [Desulfocapsa sp.]|nr:antirestriction protein ArdA [Desulfocapsa sp.]